MSNFTSSHNIKTYLKAIGATPRMIQRRADVPVSSRLIRSDLLTSLVGAGNSWRGWAPQSWEE
ncbi:MAG TPA: hypothetical protein VF026_20695 [Ktedonobacteraceae bacterium]